MCYRVLYGFVTFMQYYAKPMPNLCCTFIGRLRDPGIKPMLGRYWVICSLFCAMLAGPLFLACLGAMLRSYAHLGHKFNVRA